MITTSHASARGHRDTYEDRHVVKTLPTGGVLAAVFDGHGGFKAAETCADWIENLNISEESLKYPHLLLKNLVADLAFSTKDYEDGTTASIVYIEPDFGAAHVAIVGDSPVVIFDEMLEIHRSPEHNIRTNLHELKAAVDRGAYFDGHYVHNARGGLQMSRALGDADMEFLSHEPEIYTVQLAPYSFVLVASDGLLDPSHTGKSDELYKSVIGTIHAGGDAQDLVNIAVESAVPDNVTAILIKKPFVAAFVSPKNTSRQDYMFKDEFND